MRQIGTLPHEPEARRFSAYLARKKIDNSVDASFDLTTNMPSYALWIHNEDQIQTASLCLEQFVKNPSSAEYDVPLLDQIKAQEEITETIAEEAPAKPTSRITSLFIALCAMIFFLNALQEAQLSKEAPVVTPIEAQLLYDAPPNLEVEKAPHFRGFYDWAILKIQGVSTDSVEGPLFYKLREGQIWRLFTPCLLHAGLLHIAFNMIWLWILGRQIEQRVGWMRYVLLTIVLGVLGNTVQYLMSGPFFLGYSGVVTGLAGFIWSRERIAPWEGYPLQRSMILFLALFVIAMSALQLVSLALLLFTSVNFNPNIANAAHVGGAIFGILLGRLSFFEASGERS